MNKRGQIFSLLMVFFTLILCGIVIALFIVQQGDIHASLVSPGEVLMLRDGLTIYELKEVELIKKSLNSAEGEFGDDEFRNSFKTSFINDVESDEDMKKFIFNDLFVGDVEVRDQDKNRNLLEQGIYPASLMSFGDDKFSFGRAEIEKRSLLTAKNEGKIDFPIYFAYEFERKYSITKTTDGFEVAKV